MLFSNIQNKGTQIKIFNGIFKKHAIEEIRKKYNNIVTLNTALYIHLFFKNRHYFLEWFYVHSKIEKKYRIPIYLLPYTCIASLLSTCFTRVVHLLHPLWRSLILHWHIFTEGLTLGVYILWVLINVKWYFLLLEDQSYREVLLP